MTSFSGLTIGLSLVFGCLLLALVAELYYLLWWKNKRIVATSDVADYDYSNFAKEFFQLFCWKKHDSLHGDTITNNNNNNNQDLVKDQDATDVEVEPDLELGSTKDLQIKDFGEEGVESELMRLHNLAGPPRFLFTIKEETMEDLDSEDSRKGSRTRSLSDIILTVETPLTSSPSPLKLSPLNPLDGELNKLPSSSPPPKFKFLRNAEEKLLRRLMVEAEKRVHRNGGSLQDPAGLKSVHSTTSLTEEMSEEGSFLKFVVGNKNRDSLQCLPE